MTVFNTSFTFICDACGERIYLNDLGLFADNLANANKKIKSMGWQIKYEYRTYKHYCIKCLQPSIQLKHKIEDWE
jgi:hypothetical protein